MDHETSFAVCATADLAARLQAELQHARDQLTAAEDRFAASVIAHGNSASVPFELRRHRIECRHRLQSLRQLLAGLPAQNGGAHAASA